MSKLLYTETMHERKTKWILCLIFALFLLSAAFIFDSSENIFSGWKSIIYSETHLTTDFLEVGGLGAALFNSSLTILLDILILYLYKIEITGQLAAAIGMMSGFSFFGTHILNALPIICGGLLYVRIFRKELSKEIFKILLASSLGPFVSFIALNQSIATPWNIVFALALGLLIGFIDVPIASNAAKFHQGYTLFNAGFTSGLIAIMLTSFLRFIGFDIANRAVISKDGSNTLAYLILAFALLQVIIFSIKLKQKDKLSIYKELILHSGHSVDFDAEFSPALANLNAGLSALLCLAWVAILGGSFNGPVIGSIITVMSFSLIGKTPINILPVLISVPLFNYLVGGDPTSTASFTTTFLGCSLAPLVGTYGYLAGFAAALIHAAVNGQVLLLKGGMNLYNNGLSTGLVAAFLVPVLQELKNKNKL